MKAQVAALIMSGMLTIDQKDAHRAALDRPSASVSADGRYVAFLTHVAAYRCRHRPHL